MLCFTNQTRPPHPKDGFRAWLILSYTFMNGVLIGGITFGFGVIMPVLMEALHENRQRTALVGSLAMGFGLFLCVVTSKLCERFSCRLVNGIGLISYVVGFTLSSLCSSIYPLYITYSLLNGFGGSCTFTSNFIILRQYFKKRYSLAMGIMTAGAGIGMLSVGPAVQYMTDTFGWENTFRIFAGAFGALVPLSFILDPNVEGCEEELNETAITENYVEKEEIIKPRKFVLGFLDLSVWTFPEFTICVCAVFIGCFGHYPPIIHIIKYSEELGISPIKSSTLLVVVGTATIVSRLICGRLCDVSFIKPRYINQAGIVLSGISTILLTFASNYTHLIIFSVFYGIADGAFRLTINIMFMNTVDIPRRASGFGQANMITSFSNAAGPAIAGMMADKAGSYITAFYMAGSVSIVGGSVFFLHLCFFRNKTSEQPKTGFSNHTEHPFPCDEETDHPSAFTGPGTELNEAYSTRL